MKVRSARAVLIASTLTLLVAVGQPAMANTIMLLTPVKKPVTPAQLRFTAGLEALEKKDLAKAEAAFRESLKLDPKVVGSTFGLAQIAIDRRQTAVARQYLQQALQIDPRNVEAHVNWGRFLYGQAEIPGSEKAFLEAVTVDATYTVAHIDLGDLYMNGMNKPDLAVPRYRAAIATSPKHAGAYHALGVALGRLGKMDEAEKALTESATLAPTNPLPLFELAGVYASTKRGPQAFDTLTRVIKMQPDFAPAYLARGDILVERRDDAAALRDYNAVLKSNPKASAPYVRIGQLHQARSQWAESEAAYKQAIALDPRAAVAFNNLAWMAATRKVNTVQGVAWARKAVALSPQVAAYQDTLGWVLRANGDLPGAETALVKATADAPNDPDAHFHLGVVRQERGKRTEAIASLEKALKLSSTFTDAADARQRLVTLRAK